MVASECELALTCQSYTCVERQVGADSGTQCSSDRDCVEEQMCLSGDLWSGCGEPVRLGSGCNPYQGCPAGLVCRSDVYGFGVCGPPGEVGDACGTEDCAVGLYCAGRDFERMMKGTCAATGPYVGCDPTP
jgi:hypothetical protein